MSNKLIEALEEAINFLDKHRYRYVLIGGLANTFWGIVRATRDIDLKVLIEEGEYQEFRKAVYNNFKARLIAQETPLIVSALASNSVGIDFLMTIPGYDLTVFERAIPYAVNDLKIWLCSPEDLIIYKAIANREKDWLDIERILAEQIDKIDVNYTKKWLTQFVEALEAPEILNRFSSLFKQIRSLT